MIYHPPLEYPPDATPAEIAQQCWDVLEPGIRAAPECWLWSYKHWRFKPSGENVERYPNCANTAKRFDAALLNYGAHPTVAVVGVLYERPSQVPAKRPAVTDHGYSLRPPKR